jgi:hypothetical protein
MSEVGNMPSITIKTLAIHVVFFHCAFDYHVSWASKNVIIQDALYITKDLIQGSEHWRW